MDDVYYEPEKFGLTIVAQGDDPDACYSFDIFCVWKHADGTFYYGNDQGCSCPSPFEGFTSVDDLIRLDDWSKFVAAVGEWLAPYSDEGPSDAVKMARHEVIMATGKAMA